MTLSRSDIENVLGPVDDALAAQIIATGVTSTELLKAKTWFMADDALPEEQEAMEPRVASVIAILEDAEII